MNDVFGAMIYYLGLCKTFSYGEKAESWEVVWGTGLMESRATWWMWPLSSRKWPSCMDCSQGSAVSALRAKSAELSQRP